MAFFNKKRLFFYNGRTLLITFLRADFNIKDTIKIITVIDTLPKLLLSGAVWKIRNLFFSNGTAALTDLNLTFFANLIDFD